jgi:hypothetical protein
VDAVKRATNRQAVAVRILEHAFVPDERKAEVRERLARAKGQVEREEEVYDELMDVIFKLTR